MIVGATRDPGYGPLVMFGLGGKYVEVFRDVQFGITPSAGPKPNGWFKSIRGLPLLTGTRGEEGVALDPAISALERIAPALSRPPGNQGVGCQPSAFVPWPGRGCGR